MSDAALADAVLDTEAATMHAPHPRDWKWWARGVVGVALIGFGIALAYGRRHELHQAIDLLGNLRVGGLFVALALEAASLVAFATGAATPCPAFCARSVIATPGAGTPSVLRSVPASLIADRRQPRRTPATNLRVGASSSIA